MAIKLSNKPNIIAPGGDYPYGDIRNVDGTTEGTPVSREVYSDFHQMMERIFDLTPVIHNGLPDNSANGFQFTEALMNYIDRNKREVIFTATQTGTGAPSLSSFFKNSFGFTGATSARTAIGKYEITINGLSSGSPKLSIIQMGSSTAMGVGETFKVGLSGDKVWIESYDASGSLADGILNEAMINIISPETAVGFNIF